MRVDETDRQAALNATCTVQTCSHPRFGHGWCNKHYKRARKYGGDPLGGGSFRAERGEPEAYFWAHVQDKTDDCILWPYAKSRGYGHFPSDGRNLSVHALACELHHGPRPPGMWALHAPVICHQKLCFNWRHLSWGTVQQNHDDMIQDGTHPGGEHNPRAKLTWLQVGEVRARYSAGAVTMKTLATEHSVTEEAIWQIIHEYSWKL